MLTIFSASNYYAAGSNRGAYVKITTNQLPVIVQFMATKSTIKPLTLWERFVEQNIKNIEDLFLIIRVSFVEEQALRNLFDKFSANKSRLMHEFLLKDQNRTGRINILKY